jgi:hypothetical protein
LANDSDIIKTHYLNNKVGKGTAKTPSSTTLTFFYPIK